MASHTSRHKEGLAKADILALDLATYTGYYSVHESGTWNFVESIRRNDLKQHKALHDTLTEFITRHGIRQIVAEDVNVSKNFFDARKLSEFRGVLLCVCDELDLPEPEFVNVMTLKKWATGSGRADKQDMIRACVEKYRYHPLDDNAADACHLFHYFLRKYRIV